MLNDSLFFELQYLQAICITALQKIFPVNIRYAAKYEYFKEHKFKNAYICVYFQNARKLPFQNSVYANVK
jgi:hypothetical protein